MQINGRELMEDAYVFVNEMLISKTKYDGKVSQAELAKLHSDFMFQSKYEKCYIENLLLGAISTYHEQLQEVLLEKGIDIGEMSFD